MIKSPFELSSLAWSQLESTARSLASWDSRITLDDAAVRLVGGARGYQEIAVITRTTQYTQHGFNAYRLCATVRELSQGEG